ncbi:hypothetical protein WJX84_008343 [Apatococcus fuscideae]|uniref:SET domain-containing protein n=1 Tax=Apatococcus fuscideae TaxID=2026836 RepID=A0AAW1SVN1_9CHLO
MLTRTPGNASSCRTLFAAGTIVPGQVLVKAPEHVLLSTASARRSGLKLDDKAQDLTPTQALAAHLLHEVAKGSKSKWSLYLRQLPRSYNTLCTFSLHEARQLQVAYAVETATAAADTSNNEWRRIKPFLAALGLPHKFCSKPAWLWAISTLASRTMHDPRDPAGSLMPFGDLFNHTPPAAPTEPSFGPQPPSSTGQETVVNSSGDGYLDLHDNVYRLYAHRGYTAGEEVFLSYGALSNLDLLEHYGFVLEDNSHDRALLDPTWLKGCHPPAPHAACWLHPSGRPSWELLSLLRQMFASAAQERSRRHLAAEGKRIGRHSEMAVCKCLQAACRTALSLLPTSLDHDLALMARPEQCQAQEAVVCSETPRCKTTASEQGYGSMPPDPALTGLEQDAAVANDINPAADTGLAGLEHPAVPGNAMKRGLACSVKLSGPWASSSISPTAGICISASEDPAMPDTSLKGGQSCSVRLAAAETPAPSFTENEVLALRWRIEYKRVLMRAYNLAAEIMRSELDEGHH